MYGWRVDVENDDAILAADVFYSTLVGLDMESTGCFGPSGLADQVWKALRKRLIELGPNREPLLYKLDLANVKCTIPSFYQALNEHKCTRESGCAQIRRSVNFDSCYSLGPAAIAWCKDQSVTDQSYKIFEKLSATEQIRRSGTQKRSRTQTASSGARCALSSKKRAYNVDLERSRGLGDEQSGSESV